jgi:hypothetical protein
MPLRLHCDFPGCGRTIDAPPLSPGAGRLDLRTTTWWIVGSATACCEKHLVFDLPVTPVLPAARYHKANNQKNGRRPAFCVVMAQDCQSCGCPGCVILGPPRRENLTFNHVRSMPVLNIRG